MASPLNVAVVHYHLKPGGVTRVAENTEAAFRKAGMHHRLAVLAGPPTTDTRLRNTCEVPALAYAAPENTPDPRQLLADLRAAARKSLGTDPDLWHIHNHSLGKNTALTGAVQQLARSGEAVLLHIHDFAEEGRPDNYHTLRQSPDLLDRAYPLDGRVAYAVLNGRDYHLLQKAGIPKDRIHSLPNSVHADPPDEAPPFQSWMADLGTFSELILYPVRATRRKNFGEFLLWAALLQREPGRFGMERPVLVNTLGPTNPGFEPTWKEWRDFARAHELPVRLGIAAEVDVQFEQVVAAASALITTSVAEGFGLAFLEPWLFKKPLVGRDLPPITRDFKDAGIELHTLYDRFPVPIEWIGGTQNLRDHLRPALQRAFQDYGLDLTEKDFQEALDGFLGDDPSTVDFGRLDEALQRDVLRRVVRGEEEAAQLLSNLPDSLPSAQQIEHNARITREAFSHQAYARKLDSIYRGILERSGSTGEFLSPQAVLKAFISPADFNLLRAS